MKLRILIPPVLIVIIIALSVWVVYPSFQELRSKNSELEKAEAKLAEIQEKNSKAGALSKSLAGQSEKKNILLKYIPAQKQEEEVISNLNALAGAAGLSVYNISISVPDAKSVAQAAPQNIDASGADAEIAPAKPTASNFTVVLGVAGGYEKIKDLLGRVASFQRFNSITDMKIAKAKAVAGAAGQPAADNSASNDLQADITLNFNYIEKNNLVVNVDNEIFSKGNFEMAVIDQIESSMKTVVNALAVGGAGVANPFVK